MQQLAIASLPMQMFTQLYAPGAGLPRGTVFAQLYKPFTAVDGWDEGLPAAEGCPEPAGLDAISFAMDEIRLFLDTHPTDRQALTAYAALRQRRSALVDQLAREGRPVNFYCAGASGSWDWMDGAWPWEKEE